MSTSIFDKLYNVLNPNIVDYIYNMLQEEFESKSILNKPSCEVCTILFNDERLKADYINKYKEFLDPNFPLTPTNVLAELMDNSCRKYFYLVYGWTFYDVNLMMGSCLLTSGVIVSKDGLSEKEVWSSFY